MTDPEPLWRPRSEEASQTKLVDFARYVRHRYSLDLDELDYAALHNWSVSDLAAFWEAVADYWGVIFHDQPTTIVENQDDITATAWFSGSTLNYAEQALTHGPGRDDDDMAVIFEREDGAQESVTYGDLRARVAAARAGLVALGVQRGDRVVALAPNCVHTLVMFLATASLGAIWASCSPDFGLRAVQDRFVQLEPTVLFTVDGYQYNGKQYLLHERVERLRAALPSVRATVLLPYRDPEAAIDGTTPWAEFTGEPQPLEFTPVPFDHPLWVLYSSGTTGLPKGIVHSHGGIVVEHLKVLGLMSDLGPGDRLFWFTTTGWMMWNYIIGALLVGATVVCYDGSPTFPDTERLWSLAADHRITFFGVSAPFLHAAMKEGQRPRRAYDLSALRMIGSTGSPLSPVGFRWIAESVGHDVQIYSNSGGTDVCTPFVLSAPLVPVWSGEISCAALGITVESFDAHGKPTVDEVGELVVPTPMPSMPVKFWNDPDDKRRREAYFDDFAGVWRHGDWVKKTSRDSYVIYGRSDSTLNRGGVRMGTAEFYSVVEEFPGVSDSLVVDASTPQQDASLLLCFLVLDPGRTLDDVVPDVTAALRSELSPRHVPDRFLVVSDVPKTLNGKKCEVPVKRILLGKAPDEAVSRSALQNPEVLEEFIRLRDELRPAGIGQAS